MKILRTLALGLISLAAYIFTGCDSCGIDYEWKSHRDKFNIFMMSDTFKFYFYPSYLNSDISTPVILYDSTLTDSMRIELELDVEVVDGENIRDRILYSRWLQDTLSIEFGYLTNSTQPNEKSPTNTRSKTMSQLPQCTPAQPRLNITSAKVFIPLGTEATYIDW